MSEPDAELRPALGRAADAGDRRSATDRIRPVSERSDVPFRRHHPGSVEDVPAAARRRLGRQEQRQVGAALQRGHLLRAAEHAQPGGIGDDQRAAAAEHLRQHRQSHRLRRADADVAGPLHADAAARGQSSRSSSASASSTATTPTRASTSANLAYEHEFLPNWSGYADFIWAKGVHLTRFLNYNRSGPSCCDQGAGTGQRLRLQRQALGSAARRGGGDDEPRQVALSRAHARRAQALLERPSARGQLRRCPRTRTTTRTSATRSPIAASTSSICASTTARPTATSGTSSTSSATSKCRGT